MSSHRDHLPQPGSFARLVAVGWLLAGYSGMGLALDTELSGDFRVAEEYSTNLFLSQNKKLAQPVFGHGFDSNINLDVDSEKWGSSLTSSFMNRWYTGQDNLDYNNQIFTSKSHYSFDELGQFSLTAKYNMTATLTSALDNNIGYVFSRIPATTRSISPTWSYRYNERTLFNIGYSYQDTTYDKAAATASFVDSVAHTGFFGVTHDYTERLKLTTNASFTDYAMAFAGRRTPFGITLTSNGPAPVVVSEPARTSFIDTLSWLGGFEYRFTETIDLAFSGGVQYNETGNPAYSLSWLNGRTGQLLKEKRIPQQTDYSLSEIYEAHATKKFEKADLNFEYSRSLSPTLQGILIAYDRYGISGGYKLSPKLSANLSLSYSAQAASTQAAVSASNQTAYDRNYLELNSSLNWQWTEHWNMVASYRYVDLEYPAQIAASNHSVASHSMFLNIQYLFDKHPLK